MTRNELSQKICEGIATVFGRAALNPESWLCEQDYSRGHVTITENAPSTRDATVLCRRLEAAIGCGVHVTSTYRFTESYMFTVDFGHVLAEAAYSDGKSTIASIEKDGKKFMVGGDGSAIEVEDPDKFVDSLNKTTGSRFRKAEDLLDEALDQAALALEGTGFSIEKSEGCFRIKGNEDVLVPLSDTLPEGDEYCGSGFDSNASAIVVMLPSELLGSEELTAFIDNAVDAILTAEESPVVTPVEKTPEEWGTAITNAEPDDNMARRLSYLKNSDKLSLAISDEKFAQAVASVRKLYGNDKAEALMCIRLGAETARTIIEALGPVPENASTGKVTGRPNVLESILDNSHNEIVGVRTNESRVGDIIAKNIIHKR